MADEGKRIEAGELDDAALDGVSGGGKFGFFDALKDPSLLAQFAFDPSSSKPTPQPSTGGPSAAELKAIDDATAAALARTQAQGDRFNTSIDQTSDAIKDRADTTSQAGFRG